MRKSVLVIIVALLGCVMAAPMAHAKPPTGDTKKACADVIDGRATYRSVPDAPTATGAEVLAQMDLGAFACEKVNYTMTVLASETDSTVLATVEGVPIRPTDDPLVTPRVEFDTELAYPGPGGVVCLVITTTKSNGKVLDRAPDTGCISFILDSDVTGFQKFR